MAKAGKSWFHHKWHDGSRSEHLRWYYTGNTRVLQNKYTGKESRGWKSLPGNKTMHAGIKVKQSKRSGRWR